jgi:hypothetical protein
MPHGKKAALKTPIDAYVDRCRATWISTGHPTRKFRRSSPRRTSSPLNARGSRRLLPRRPRCSMEVQPCPSQRDRRPACFGGSGVTEPRKLAGILVAAHGAYGALSVVYEWRGQASSATRTDWPNAPAKANRSLSLGPFWKICPALGEANTFSAAAI